MPDLRYTLRPATAADIPAIHALARRCETHDRLPMASPPSEFEEWLDDPHLDLARDTRVAELDGGGGLIAWGRIWQPPGGEGAERAFLPGQVDPAWRGKGVGRALLAWQIARAEERLRAAPGARSLHVRVGAFDFQESALALHARFGLVPARVNHELLRDLAEPLPPRPDVPGIAIVPWDAARSEDARVAQNAAFADHWGATPRDAAAWEHDLASSDTRLDLSFLAVALRADGSPGEIAAVCRNGAFPSDEAVTGRKDGWILNLSTVRAHRKKGIASALIVASLEAFRDAGFTHSALGVDSENTTGAYGLYERLGYRVMHRLVIGQKEVTP